MYILDEDLYHKVDASEYIFPHISWLIGGVNANMIETLTPEQQQIAPTFVILFEERFIKINQPLSTIRILLEYLEKEGFYFFFLKNC